MKSHFHLLLPLFLLGTFNAAYAADSNFPSGNNTPEGVAADLARVFINSDVSLFTSTCIPPYGGGETRPKYESFLAHVKKSVVEESKKTEKSPSSPKQILRIYKSRRLSASGPVSYGSEVFGFDDIQFVDVVVELGSGKLMNNRTMVIKYDNRWFVHPLPTASPLLSIGLNEESESTELWNSKGN